MDVETPNGRQNSDPCELWDAKSGARHTIELISIWVMGRQKGVAPEDKAQTIDTAKVHMDHVTPIGGCARRWSSVHMSNRTPNGGCARRYSLDPSGL